MFDRLRAVWYRHRAMTLLAGSYRLVGPFAHEHDYGLAGFCYICGEAPDA